MGAHRRCVAGWIGGLVGGALFMHALNASGADPLVADASAPAACKIVRTGSHGRLVYARLNARGDVIPDFSHCGYMGGGVPIPSVPVAVTLAPVPGDGDDTARIQSAIDQVAQRPCDTRGCRGAVLLRRGAYRVAGSIRIGIGGIVLRGEGPD